MYENAGNVFVHDICTNLPGSTQLKYKDWAYEMNYHSRAKVNSYHRVILLPNLDMA